MIPSLPLLSRVWLFTVNLCTIRMFIFAHIYYVVYVGGTCIKSKRVWFDNNFVEIYLLGWLGCKRGGLWQKGFGLIIGGGV
jgi:hypothetical protein